MIARLRRLVPTPRAAALAAAGGALFGLAMPPVGSVAAGIGVPALLAALVLDTPRARARTAVRDGWWLGILGAWASAWWAALVLARAGPIVGGFGIPFTALFVGSIPAIAAAILWYLVTRWRWPVAPALGVGWVAGEWIVAHVPDIGLSWMPLALSVAQHPLFAQSAELSGPSGVAFVLAMAGGFVASAWLARRSGARAVALRLAGATLTVGALAGYGALRLATITLQPLGRVTVIQPNVPQEEKSTGGTEREQVGRLAAMSRATAARRSDLVVWPETALNGFLREFPEWTDTLRAVTRAVDAPLVSGVVDLDVLGGGQFLIYNSALLTGRDGTLDAAQHYRKETLVPLLEMTPFVRYLPFLTQGTQGFGHGGAQPPFRVGIGRAGVLICFESAFPAAARGVRQRGADFLVVLTNDAWLGRTPGPSQHLAHLRLRAVETRMSAVQDANSGPSALIDPLGRIAGETALFVAAAPTFAVSTTDVVTPFVRFGDTVGVVSTLIAVGVLLAHALARRRR